MMEKGGGESVIAIVTSGLRQPDRDLRKLVKRHGAL